MLLLSGHLHPEDVLLISLLDLTKTFVHTFSILSCVSSHVMRSERNAAVGVSVPKFLKKQVA